MTCAHCSTPQKPIHLERVKGWTYDGPNSVQVEFYCCPNCGHEEDVDDEPLDMDDDS